MKDSDIIKALECCINEDCDSCPICTPNEECIRIMHRKALEIIKRQQAEIETLQKHNPELPKEGETE